MRIVTPLIAEKYFNKNKHYKLNNNGKNVMDGHSES
jgi:hypothetical protein